MIVKITAQDIASQQPLAEGWYTGKVTGTKTTTKPDGSITIEFSAQLPDRLLKFWFSTKLMKMAIPFVEACTKSKLADGVDFDFDPDVYVGNELQFKVVQDIYNGSINNKISDFLPLGVEAAL